MAAKECLQVTIIDTLIEEDTLGGLVFLAFLLALLIGFLFGILIMRYIFREIEDHNARKKKRLFSVPVIEEDCGGDKTSPSLIKKIGSNRIFPDHDSGSGSVAIEMGNTNTKDIGISGTSLNSPDGQLIIRDHIFADALIKGTGDEMEVELQNQDFGFIQKMEQSLRNEKSETFLHLLKMILTFLLSKSRIDETFKRSTLAKYEQIIEDLESNSRKEDEEKELRETLTDSTDLDNALEQLHSKYSKKKDLQLIELQEQFGRDLQDSSGLTKEEADQILSKLMTNFASAEKRRSEEINRQSMVLHERLAKRQVMAQQRASDKREEIEEFQERKKQPNNIIAVLKKRGKLMDHQCSRILEEYHEDLKNLEEKHQQAVLKHEADLAVKLRRKRDRETKLLTNELEGQKEEFEAKANQMITEGNMTAEDYLEAFHQLKVQQQAKMEEEEENHDKLEAEEFQDLAQQFTDRWKRSVSKLENELFLEIKQQANLSSKEAERMMKKHEEQVEEYTSKRTRERERYQVLLQERLNERRKRWKREAEERALEQDQMSTEQENTIKQVLNTQIGLNEQLRKQVLLEHEQNMTALNNHLQISRIRQQKKVEYRLAQRRARLTELKKKMEQERSLSQEQDDPDQMKVIARAQNIEYQAEVKKMEEEHQAALEDLRRRLASVTEEALKDQDERLGKILGKLQLEVARRDEIIKHRDVAIRNLEKNIVDTLTREGTMADVQADRILKQHQTQVDRLNQNIEMEKEKQMMKIREKIEMKQLKKERMMEAKRAREMEEIKAKGVKTASSALSLILSNQNHKKDMEELENEMQLELRRQTELLHKEMQQQFVKDLQEEEEVFLARVAEVSSIPEDELMMAIKSSAKEVGMDSKLTKQIARDVRKRVRSTRTTED